MYICYIHIAYEEIQPSTYENQPIEKGRYPAKLEKLAGVVFC